MKRVLMVGLLVWSTAGGVCAADCQAAGLVLVAAGGSNIAWRVDCGKKNPRAHDADCAHYAAIAYVRNESLCSIHVTVNSDQSLGEQLIDVAARILVSLRRFVKNPCGGDVDDFISERYAIVGPLGSKKFLWRDPLLRGKAYHLAPGETFLVDLLLSEKERGVWEDGYVEQFFTITRE